MPDDTTNWACPECGEPVASKTEHYRAADCIAALKASRNVLVAIARRELERLDRLCPDWHEEAVERTRDLEDARAASRELFTLGQWTDDETELIFVKYPFLRPQEDILPPYEP